MALRERQPFGSSSSNKDVERAPFTSPGEPDTSKYSIPVSMPTWAKWLTAMITIGVILIAVCGIMLIVLLVKGHTMGETVTQATESIQDLSALESIMPMMLNLLQALYNNSNVIPQEIFGASGFDNPVPQVNYINILNDSVRMAYRFSGLCSNPEAPAVILVHALSSSSVEWIAEMLLYGQESMCAIAVDLVGHGNSDPTNENLGGTVPNQAMYLFEFLYQLGILANSSRTVIAVGSSFGGSVVVQMLDDYPGIADRMILVNPVPYLVKPGDPNATQAEVTGAGSVQSFVELAGLALYNASAYTGLMSLAIVSGSSCSPDALEPVVEAYQQVAIAADPGAISQGLISLASMDHTSALKDGIIPVLMITGGQTGLETVSSFNYALLAEQARNLVGRLATLHVIGSASGAVHITHRTLFHTLSQQFLSGLDHTCDPASIAWSQVE